MIAVRPPNVERSQLLLVIDRFVGEIEQVPPMYSALKRDGKPLYEYARAGIEVERAPRKVCIRTIELLSFGDGFAEIDVACSKGTYVRTLAADIGEVLGCGAHLTALRRLTIGSLDVAQAVSLEQVEQMSIDGRDRCLLATDTLLAALPIVQLDATETARILHGQSLPWLGDAGARYRLYGDGGGFLGTGELSADGWLSPRRLIASSPTNP